MKIDIRDIRLVFHLDGDKRGYQATLFPGGQVQWDFIGGRPALDETAQREIAQLNQLLIGFIEGGKIRMDEIVASNNIGDSKKLTLVGGMH
jgi:hypothetical protein